MDLNLRPASGADSDWCFGVHEAAMRAVIEEMYGPWDVDVQRAFHDRWFDPSRIRIIQVEHADVGLLDTRPGLDEVYLGRIEILPEWQGRGIGSEIIRRVIAQAGDRSVALHVFAINPARRLYERLGFRQVEESEGRVLMCHAPLSTDG